MTDWASMDNSPRNEYLAKGGTAVDTSSQMVLFAEPLAQMAELLGKPDDAAAFRREAADVARAINEKMWDAERKFYFDLTVDGTQAPAKTIAAFWTLLAGVASPEQAEALAAELRNPASFGRRHRVPTTPADQPGFDPAGGYWRGAVWSPTNTMVIRGLERYGQQALADELALEHLRMVGEVFQTTGTVWENYAPDSASPGKPAKPRFRRLDRHRADPVLHRVRHRPEAGRAAQPPDLGADFATKRCGCERFRFNGHTATLVAEPAAAAVPACKSPSNPTANSSCGSSAAGNNGTRRCGRGEMRLNSTDRTWRIASRVLAKSIKQGMASACPCSSLCRRWFVSRGGRCRNCCPTRGCCSGSTSLAASATPTPAVPARRPCSASTARPGRLPPCRARPAFPAGFAKHPSHESDGTILIWGGKIWDGEALLDNPRRPLEPRTGRWEVADAP